MRISFTSIVGKILESIIKAKGVSYFERYSLITDS